MTSLFQYTVITDVFLLLGLAVLFSIIDIKSLKQIWELNESVVEKN